MRERSAPIRASTLRVSRRRSGPATPSTRWLSSSGAIPVSISSGSWARTTWQASTAGVAGGDIARMMPIAVIDRPGWTLKATHSRAASALGWARVDEQAAEALADLSPACLDLPAWTALLCVLDRAAAPATNFIYSRPLN